MDKGELLYSELFSILKKIPSIQLSSLCSRLIWERWEVKSYIIIIVFTWKKY